MPFQILAEYSAGTPGACCFVCKSSRRPGEKVIDCFVDTDDLDWIGPSEEFRDQHKILSGYLQICETCWREVARSIDMIDASSIADMQARVQDILTENTRLGARMATAEAALLAIKEHESLVPKPEPVDPDPEPEPEPAQKARRLR